MGLVFVVLHHIRKCHYNFLSEQTLLRNIKIKWQTIMICMFAINQCIVQFYSVKPISVIATLFTSFKFNQM